MPFVAMVSFSAAPALQNALAERRLLAQSCQTILLLRCQTADAREGLWPTPKADDLAHVLSVAACGVI